MLKRILLTTLFCLLTAFLGGAYFYHAGKYARERAQEEICTGINVILADSIENRAVTRRDVLEMIDGGRGLIGHRMQDINIFALESSIAARGEVRKVEVFKDMTGYLNIMLEQRHPVMRFDNGRKSFYIDSTGYMFPIHNVANVPIVTGRIPVSYSSGQQGYPETDKEKKWMDGMMAVGDYIESHDYWRSQIEQIDIAENGDICLCTRDSRYNIIFGDASDIETKFSKLTAFYKSIAPLEEAAHYKSVNLKYKKQIICR